MRVLRLGNKGKIEGKVDKELWDNTRAFREAIESKVSGSREREQ